MLFPCGPVGERAAEDRFLLSLRRRLVAARNSLVTLENTRRDAGGLRASPPLPRCRDRRVPRLSPHRSVDGARRRGDDPVLLVRALARLARHRDRPNARGWTLEFVGPFEETGWKLAGAIVPIACAVGPAHSRGCGTRHRLRHALSPASRRRPRGCLCGKRRGVGGDHQGRTKVARKHKTRPSAVASDRRNPAPLHGNPHESAPSSRSW